MKLNVEFQEPDRKKKIKRIIAREGLIILGVYGIGFALACIDSIFGLTFLIYPFYLLIRFILWAIKTLKEK